MPPINALTCFQIAALTLLSLGLIGMITRRTFVGMLIAVELMLNGAGLSIVAAAKLTPASDSLGQLTALFVMGLAAAEATLVLAMLIVVHRRFGTVLTGAVSTLKGQK